MKRVLDAREQPAMNVSGSRIRAARKKAKLTQEQLSIKLETMAIYVCRGSISRIENGVRLVADYELQAIAKILRVPIESLFPELED